VSRERSASPAFTERSIDTEDASLATRDYGGNGPALVLMHGAGMEQGALQPLAEQLRGSFRVITFDFRGHGGSGSGPWTVASAVHDVDAVVRAYGLDVPAVGGHSLGGMVAAGYGLQHPSCPGVINIDGHGRGQVEQYVGHEETEVRRLWDQQQRRVERLTRGIGAVAVRAVMLLQRKRPTSSAETLHQVLRETDELDLFAMYRQLSCPLLVFNATAPEDRWAMKLLAGSATRLVGAYRQGLSRDLAALAAEKDLVDFVTVDATHMVIRTHPELVAHHIAAFLQARPAQVP
jgi:pimeloyl-ACP methyl ester carboxylesterase